MEKLFDENTNWSISRHSEDSELIEGAKGDTLLALSSTHQFYASNFAWNFKFQKLILKPNLEFYFDSFFDPMKEFLGIALFWDCLGNIIISEISPIYISKNNSRKLHHEIQQQIPKGIKGALIVQFFVLEQEFNLESFLININMNTISLSQKLKERINTNSFKNCADFLAKAFLEMIGGGGQELFRKNYPSFCLNSSAHFEEEETPFYNTVIHIKI